MKKLVLFLAIGLFASTLVSCSGGTSVVSSAVTGVDTPSTISVVTAQ